MITEDIRDIHGPIHIPYPWIWIVWALLFVLLIYLSILVFRAWKRRRPAIVKLPHEIALERLNAARALMKADQAREFSIAVSGAVRVYIEDRFQEKAAHRTTEEFLHDLLHLPNGRSPGLSLHAPLLETFLQHCDLAKFGRWSLSIPEMEAMHESARKFVSETAPAAPSSQSQAASSEKKPAHSEH